MMNRIDLDHAATTRLDPEVLEEMKPYLLMQYGNPSSIHGTGRESARAIDRARRQTAAAIGAEPREIFFTSGGSESDNWALKGVAFHYREKGRHIVTTSIEHPAVLNTCRWLEKQGFEVTYLPVGSEGIVSPEDVRKSIRPDTILISVMMANNEVGSVQPVGEIAQEAHAAGVLFHTDAVQAAGALKLDVHEMGADLLSLSAHKFYGPKGTGILYIRDGVALDSLIHGGAQERGHRAGTENTAGIVGAGVALERAVREMEINNARILKLRNRLSEGIMQAVPGARLNGDPVRRLPNNCHFTFPELADEALLLRLDLAGIAASGGSACTAGSLNPSHVLLAMGCSREEASSGIRITLGKENTDADVEEILRILPGIVWELQRARH